jgi:membrane-associated phospholipid phosphatase
MHPQSLHRNELLPTIARSSPAVIPLIALLYCMVQPSYNAFYILVLVISAHLLNFGLKTLVAKPIYNALGKKSLPVLGSGERPANANSCGLYLDGKSAKSFGMPSGHSQIVWTIGSYLLCRLVNNFIDKQSMSITITIFEYIWLIISFISILVMMMYVSYSRVYIEGCHTIQQVIIGAIVGSITGFLGFYFENSIINGFG